MIEKTNGNYFFELLCFVQYSLFTIFNEVVMILLLSPDFFVWFEFVCWLKYIHNRRYYVYRRAEKYGTFFMTLNPLELVFCGVEYKTEKFLYAMLFNECGMLFFLDYHGHSYKLYIFRHARKMCASFFFFAQILHNWTSEKNNWHISRHTLFHSISILFPFQFLHRLVILLNITQFLLSLLVIFLV